MPYQKQPNFLDSYLEYTSETECPIGYHRWSILGALSAWLGRNFYTNIGHSRVNSNMYVMLMGVAGCRKTTAIKIATKLLKSAGYSSFSSSKTSKEKFLADLATSTYSDDDEENDLQLFDFSIESDDAAAEVLIAADEFNNFAGNGNIEFLSLLGELWDFEGLYTHGKMTSKSIRINNPVVSMLSGNTPTNFALAFPKESIGQGIFSRLLLIHGEPTGRRITFPRVPPPEATAALITCLQQIKEICNGPAEFTKESLELLDYIYTSHKPTIDPRFESYENRRFTHLLKLCLLVTAAHKRRTITGYDVVYANTILTHAEHSMSRALGEFGMSQKSEINNKLMQLLRASNKPLTMKEIFSQLSNDVQSFREIAPMIEGLLVADKILRAGNGFLAKQAVFKEFNYDHTVDFNLLTKHEREYI